MPEIRRKNIMNIISKVKVYKIYAKLIMPFRISSGQHNALENIIFEIELDNGIKGFGEAPIATHITGETIDETYKNLKLFSQKIKGKKISNYFSILLLAQDFFENNRAALLSVETAILDAMSKNLGIPIWKLFGKKTKKLHTDITIVIGEVDEAIEFTKKMRKQGFKIFKIKTGLDMDKDIKRIIAVKNFGKNPEIYIDANCAYNVNEAVYLIKELSKHNIIPSLIEQPLKKDDIEGFKFLTKKFSSIPICADETAYSIDDVYKIIKNKIASAINIKLTKFGIMRAFEVAKLAIANDMKLMIGQMMETQIATFAALHFVSGFGCFDFIDLDTPYFIKDDILKYNRKIMSSDGIYDISYVKKGLGVEGLKSN